MPDNLTPAARSYCMSRVRSRDTAPEVKLRSQLHRQGFRFRKHVRELPGSPDLVLVKQRVAVFVDGNFWHGYRFEQWRHTLSAFWREKIERNRQRDRSNFRRLRRRGWTVIRIWQHQIDRDLDVCATRVAAAAKSNIASRRRVSRAA